MMGDVRDRILGLLSSGPATVAGVAARLDLPGGVVSYQLKLLEQAGLVWVGASRTVHGVPTPVYVSTAAAVPPPLSAPAPLPGLTWTGTGRFPAPVWTTAAHPGGSAAEPGPAPADDVPASTVRPERADSDVPSATPGVARVTPEASGMIAPTPGAGRGGGAIPTPRMTDRDPRLVDVRRVPLDDATFAEFAARLEALTREFAARATPGSPAAEVAITFYRPPGAGASGYGS
ncbi:helix-turn-helix domain-containing protein [Krasilnikovia sp. MM14-A1004]|uniref:helix-turn-helix domain-containing protein n=1 Tax=Krasilnikovia sp. MM14-A1004 TaxID=3373541 RepID=UPI00399D3261